MNVGLIIKQQEDDVYHECIFVRISIFADIFNQTIDDMHISLYDEVFKENALHEE